MTTILPLVPKYFPGGAVTATLFSTYDHDLAPFHLYSYVLPQLFATYDRGLKPRRVLSQATTGPSCHRSLTPVVETNFFHYQPAGPVDVKINRPMTKSTGIYFTVII